MPDNKRHILETPATLEGLALRKDGSATLRFSTQELSDADFVMAKQFYSHFGNLIFSENTVQPQDIPRADAEFEGKTPSQRLRSVIYVFYRQAKDAKKTELSFEDFYRGQLENIIDQYKEKL